MSEFLLIAMIICLAFALIAGFPVAFVLAGVSMLFAFIGHMFGVFDLSYIAAFPNRLFGIMQNDLLIAVPLFVFMGVMLERSKIAEELLEGMAQLLGRFKNGLGISVVLVGALLAASTGIVGATVVTMGLISLPCMLKNGYNPKLATGTICASGTLGQIIPPSIVLILLGDQISGVYQTTQMEMGILSPDTVSIADLFMGALVPGTILVILYMMWLVVASMIWSQSCPKKTVTPSVSPLFIAKVLLPPLLLILMVLGSILSGIATATESAAIGAMGAIALSLIKKKLTRANLTEVVQQTTHVTCMVFTILIGAAMFTLVFRGYGGDDMVHDLLVNLPGGLFTVMLLTMFLMFILGFFLDFIEIIFVVVPIIAPILLKLGADPVWLAIMIAVNLQTSFLTPPFGFALFYLRGVAPAHILTSDIYKGIIPFVMIQLFVLVLLSMIPELTTWLPDVMYGGDAQPVAPKEGNTLIDDNSVDF